MSGNPAARRRFEPTGLRKPGRLWPRSPPGGSKSLASPPTMPRSAPPYCWPGSERTRRLPRTLPAGVQTGRQVFAARAAGSV